MDRLKSLRSTDPYGVNELNQPLRTTLQNPTYLHNIYGVSTSPATRWRAGHATSRRWIECRYLSPTATIMIPSREYPPVVVSPRLMCMIAPIVGSEIFLGFPILSNAVVSRCSACLSPIFGESHTVLFRSVGLDGWFLISRFFGTSFFGRDPYQQQDRAASHLAGP